VNRTRRLTEEVYYGEQCGRFYDQKHVSFIRRPGERAYWRFRVTKKAMKIETMRAVGKSLENDRLLFRRWNRLVDEGINPLEVD
jgi:hypothetical protein